MVAGLAKGLRRFDAFDTSWIVSNTANPVNMSIDF